MTRTSSGNLLAVGSSTTTQSRGWVDVEDLVCTGCCEVHPERPCWQDNVAGADVEFCHRDELEQAPDTVQYIHLLPARIVLPSGQFFLIRQR